MRFLEDAYEYYPAGETRPASSMPGTCRCVCVYVCMQVCKVLGEYVTTGLLSFVLFRNSTQTPTRRDRAG